MKSMDLCFTDIIYTHLGEVIDESKMSLLQLCPGQSRQRVGIVQLFAVVCWKQVWVQPNHMGGICRTQEGEFVVLYSTYDTWASLLTFWLKSKNDLRTEFIQTKNNHNIYRKTKTNPETLVAQTWNQKLIRVRKNLSAFWNTFSQTHDVT